MQITLDIAGDVTGSSIFNQGTSEFEFRPGPVFTQILLADEVNRATPRAQAALLECMAERQVSVDNNTYLLKRPFFVIATQRETADSIAPQSPAVSTRESSMN